LLFVSFYSISITSSPGQSLETGKEQLWNQVSSWAYQLQSPSPDEIAKSPYDLVVIDYSSDGSVDGQFSPSDLKKMQKREGKADRLVIAYMSIGEAEPYRFYWKKSWNTEKPFWLLKPNPKWPDNYRVQYWNGEWKKILFGSDSSYLDRIVDAGFDGVYLDIVDGYEAFQKKDKYARQNMIDLVKAIADYARNVKGKKNFGVFPQNAPELIKDPSYLAVINGIGKEEVYFLDTDEASPDEDREWDEKLLKKLTASGRLVLAVDYCEDKENIAEAQRRCKENGFLSYCTTVELDKLSPK
jgi:cysteinyl-tRNA synthetase